MKKWFFFILLCSIVGTAAPWFTQFARAQSNKAIESTMVCVSLPLTGDGATWGAELKAVIEFANQKIAHGRLKFLYEDDKCAAKEAAAIAQKFTAVDRVPFAMVACSAAVIGASTIYTKAATPVMIPLASASDITMLPKNFYRVSTNDRNGAMVLVEALKKEDRRIAIIVDENEYAEGLYRNIKAVLPQEMASEVAFYRGDSSDFRSIVVRMAKFKPDAFVTMPLNVGTAVSLIRQIRGLGNRQKIYGFYMVYPQGTLEGLKGEGIYNVLNSSTLPLLNGEGKQLYEEYVAAHGKPNYDLIFTAGIEAVRAISQAVETHQADPVEFWRHAQFQGIIGPWKFNDQREVDFWRFEVSPVW